MDLQAKHKLKSVPLSTLSFLTFKKSIAPPSLRRSVSNSHSTMTPIKKTPSHSPFQTTPIPTSTPSQTPSQSPHKSKRLYSRSTDTSFEKKKENKSSISTRGRHLLHIPRTSQKSPFTMSKCERTKMPTKYETIKCEGCRKSGKLPKGESGTGMWQICHTNVISKSLVLILVGRQGPQGTLGDLLLSPF